MRIKLLIFLCFCAINFSLAQNERDIINKIDSINTIAINLYDSDEIKASIQYVNLAVKLSDSIDDSYGRAIANLTLGNIYYKMKENKDAEKYYLKSSKASKEINDNYLIAKAYLNLGNVYSNGYHKKEESLSLYKWAMSFAQKINKNDTHNSREKQIISLDILTSISSAYLNNNQPEESLVYLLRAQKLSNQLSFVELYKSKIVFLMGRYYANKSAHHKAIDNYEKAIEALENSQEDNNTINLIIADIYKEYSNSFALLGEKEAAYEMLLKHNTYREKVINEEKIKQSKIAKINFDIESYKRDIKNANKEKLLQKAITEKANRMNNIITIGIILLLICLVTLYNYYLSKRKLNAILQTENKYLEIAKSEAERSLKLKSSFISSVSHELRTPLYGVVGLTSLLLKSNDLSERDNKFLKSLKFSGDYLLNLINDVLQIGKIESEKIELNSTSINLKKLVHNITDSFEYQLEAKSNKLHLNFDEGIPQYVFGDNVRLSQVLINLLGNSLKFTNNGNITLSLMLLSVDKHSANIRFEVKDDGPGIPKDKQNVIFENFSQLNREHNDDYQGTGLGLSIVKNLVALFGSEIELVSNVGKGSEFSFSVNFKIDNDAIIKQKNAKRNKLFLDTRNKILVVEDNKINQIVTQNILAKENFECDIVENGLLAIKAVQSKEYDLVLMDLNMPVMGGYEATINIREFNTEIPIVALTAANIEDVKDTVTASGFNDVIIKPYDDYEFYQKIIRNIYDKEGTAA